MARALLVDFNEITLVNQGKKVKTIIACLFTALIKKKRFNPFSMGFYSIFSKPGKPKILLYFITT